MYNSYEDIENYLAGGLSEAEKTAFENQLQTDAELQKKLKIVKASSVALMQHKLSDIHSLLQEERASQKNKAKVKKAISIALVSAFGVGALYYATQKETVKNEPKKEVVATDSVVSNNVESKLIESQEDVAPSNVQTPAETSIVQKDKNTIPSNKTTQNQVVNTQTIQLPVEQKNTQTETVVQPLGESTVKHKQVTVAPVLVNCASVHLEATIDVVKDCKGDGEIIVKNIKGGTEPYTIILNERPPVKQTHFKWLSEGEYAVTIVDKNNCEKKYEHIHVAKALCNLVYDINASNGEQWQGPVVEQKSELIILDKSGNFVYKSEIEAGQSASWDARDQNNNLRIGYFVFMIQNASNEIIKGSITVTE